MARMPPQYGNKKVEDKPDPFIQSRSVKGLMKANFLQVLSNKDTAAMVMFYDPDCIFCQSARPHFLKAAKTTAAKNRVYAAVDCTKEEQLCEMENVKALPAFKLYVGGKFLSRYNQSPNFVNIRSFVENAPLETHIDNTQQLRTEDKTDIIYVSK